MIELEVHHQLRALLQAQGQVYWSHHLTMGRLVARALRLGRGVLVQTGSPPVGTHARYRPSYLVPLLMWSGGSVLVVPEAVQQRLLTVEIPQIQQWLNSPKPVRVGDRWPNADFQGLLLTTPAQWLGDRLGSQERFPAQIPTLLDGVDELESWSRQQLTTHLPPLAWDELMRAYPSYSDSIRGAQVQLTATLFHRPTNPYEEFALEQPDWDCLRRLADDLTKSIPIGHLPALWADLFRAVCHQDSLLWATLHRRAGNFSLRTAPADVSSALAAIWSQQPVVLIGSALDLETEAPIYRQRVGLGDLTCLKFAPDRQQECIQLYLPDRLPLPNTPEFQPALLREVRSLLWLAQQSDGFTVVLIGDTPLRSQVAAALAAELGSRVQVEKTCLDEQGVLVTGWEFWRQNQALFPLPQLMVMATLPIPSLENPLVAGLVAYYKRQRQDWFRMYLLPTALSELQHAIAPVRECQGTVALLDSRVICRSYGQQFLAALSPMARINYLDGSTTLIASDGPYHRERW